MSESSISPSTITSKSTAPLLENDNPMLTRAKIGKSKLKVFVTRTLFEPTSANQALTKHEWIKEMQAEFNALHVNATWTLTTLPSDRKVRGC